MWRHPITAKQLRVLEEEWGIRSTPVPTTEADGVSAPPVQPLQETDQSNGDQDEGDGWFEVLRPQRKVLACGDAGDGAMIEWPQIVAVIEERLGAEDRSFTNCREDIRLELRKKGNGELNDRLGQS
ncbi:hypothetical protein F5Y12DRAFT_720435 [Xylaria sp. FL1777]|nr:hypothetical protein F5Y12DRAFT_720435 [Xylaria sp. FL1777]